MHCSEVSIWQQLLKLQYYAYLDAIYQDTEKLTLHHVVT